MPLQVNSRSLIKMAPSTEGRKKPASISVIPSRKLSVFWRVENFSLLGFYTSVKSACFGLRCGAETKRTQKFYFDFHPSYSVYAPGTLELCKKESRYREQQLPHLRVTFSALLSTGERHIFNTKGEILYGHELTDCKEWFKRYSFLLENKLTYLPGDALTFVVQFQSEDPIFDTKRLFGRTWIPIKKTFFEWEIDFSKKRCGASVPDPPVELLLKAALDWPTNAYRILVMPRYLAGHPVVCEVFLREDSGELFLVKKLGVVNLIGELLVLSKKFCQYHVRETSGKHESLTLHFAFCTDNGKPVLEEFNETFFDDDSGYRKERLRPSIPPPQIPKVLCAENDIEGVEKGIENVDCKGSKNVPETETFEETEEYFDFNVDVISNPQNLQSQPILPDFTLRVGDRSFLVHKAILSASSTVFRDIFETDMLDKKENFSEVADLDEDTMDRLLRFVYFLEFGDLDACSVTRLFAAADKYQIEALKTKCLESLAGGLSVEKVCGVLSLADEDSDHPLVAKAKELVFQNSDAVFRSEGWQRVMKEKSELAGSIMHEKFLEQQIS